MFNLLKTWNKSKGHSENQGWQEVGHADLFFFKLDSILIPFSEFLSFFAKKLAIFSSIVFRIHVVLPFFLVHPLVS